MCAAKPLGAGSGAGAAGDDDALAIPAVLAAAATRLSLPLSTIVMSISFGSLVRARASMGPNLATGTLGGNPLFSRRDDAGLDRGRPAGDSSPDPTRDGVFTRTRVPANDATDVTARETGRPGRSRRAKL